MVDLVNWKKKAKQDRESEQSPRRNRLSKEPVPEEDADPSLSGEA
jgi:hypothetical protein